MTQFPMFEIPQQMRELAEKNIEQARAAYDQFMAAAVKAQAMMPANPMTAGMKEAQDRAMKFTQANLNANFDLAASLAKAKDPKEILEIQTKYAQSQMQAFQSQTQELGKLMTEAAQKSMPKA
jgi:phasin